MSHFRGQSEHLRKVPAVFLQPSPPELTPDSPIYLGYVEKRVWSIQETLAAHYSEEKLYDLALEYVTLEQEAAIQGFLEPGKQMQFDVLNAIIFESGYFIPLNEIRDAYQRSIR